jgi:hypothetical protein
MITALVQFNLPTAMTPEQAREVFLSTAPRYLGMPGLIRKYYLLSDDGTSAGGVYLWRSREEAERVYTAEWRRFIVDKYGVEPNLTYFASPVVVDNPLGRILTEA